MPMGGVIAPPPRPPGSVTVFAAEKSCFFLQKKIDFIKFLGEISAANFILEGRRSRNFSYFH